MTATTSDNHILYHDNLFLWNMHVMSEEQFVTHGAFLFISRMTKLCFVL